MGQRITFTCEFCGNSGGFPQVGVFYGHDLCWDCAKAAKVEAMVQNGQSAIGLRKGSTLIAVHYITEPAKWLNPMIDEARQNLARHQSRGF